MKLNRHNKARLQEIIARMREWSDESVQIWKLAAMNVQNERAMQERQERAAESNANSVARKVASLERSLNIPAAEKRHLT